MIEGSSACPGAVFLIDPDLAEHGAPDGADHDRRGDEAGPLPTMMLYSLARAGW